MKPEFIALVTPFVRYSLIFLSSYLITQGADPTTVGILNSPDILEAVVGVGIGIATIVWYIYSKSRAALKSK